jgi:hypothetical protein
MLYLMPDSPNLGNIRPKLGSAHVDNKKERKIWRFDSVKNTFTT